MVVQSLFAPSLSLSCVTVLLIPDLSLPTLHLLRGIVWSTVMDLFEIGSYAECLSWLQRYTRQMPLDDDETCARGLRAMAIVAHQLGDFLNELTYADDARKMSDTYSPSSATSLLATGIIIRAAIGLQRFDRVETELKRIELTCKVATSEVRSQLSLIAYDLITIKGPSHLALLALDLLLRYQSSEPSVHLSTNGAASVNIIQPFTELQLLAKIVQLGQTRMEELKKEEVDRKKQQPILAHPNNSSAMDTTDDCATTTVESLAMSMVQYGERLNQVLISEQEPDTEVNIKR